MAFNPFQYPQYPSFPQPAQQASSRMIEVVPVDSVEVAESWPCSVGVSLLFMARDDSFIAVRASGINGQSSFVVYDKRPPAPPAPAFDPAAYLRRDELKSAVEAILAAQRGGADE